MTRHRFDAFSFLAGATTVTIALLVLFDAASLRTIDLRVIGPVVVLALGAALLVGSGRDREPVHVASTEAGERHLSDDPAAFGADHVVDGDDGDADASGSAWDADADPGTVDTLVLDRDDRDDVDTSDRDDRER